MRYNNNIIARKGFNTLYIDAIYDNIVCCRVCCDGYYLTEYTAETEAEAIDIFMRGGYI